MKARSVTRRLLIGLGMVVVLLGGAGASSQAYADGITDSLCKEVPKPYPPNWGAPGLLTAPKDLATVPDQTPDPFAPGSTLRISDVYGWSAHYDVYDLGCGNSFLSDPAAVMNTNLANSNIEFTGGLGSNPHQSNEHPGLRAHVWFPPCMSGPRSSPEPRECLPCISTPLLRLRSCADARFSSIRAV